MHIITFVSSLSLSSSLDLHLLAFVKLLMDKLYMEWSQHIETNSVKTPLHLHLSKGSSSVRNAFEIDTLELVYLGIWEGCLNRLWRESQHLQSRNNKKLYILARRAKRRYAFFRLGRCDSIQTGNKLSSCLVSACIMTAPMVAEDDRNTLTSSVQRRWSRPDIFFVFIALKPLNF